MYQERPAGPAGPATAGALAGSVLWSRTEPAAGAEFRVVPDGCLDLIWLDGELLVAGPDTGPYLGTSPPGARYLGLRFAPGTGPVALGVPADELRDRRVPLAALWPADRVRRLADQIGTAPDPGRVLESAAARALLAARDRRPGPADRIIPAVLARLRAGGTVAGTAAAVGLSERQLHRRCLPAFGYGPKTLARILRMRRAVALARSGTPFAEVAASTGYADQAHLSREVRALTGVPLSAC